MNINFTLVLLILTVLSFTSCISYRKMFHLNQSIENQKRLERKLDSTLVILNSIRSEKSLLGELDDSSNIAIKRILDKELEASRARKDSLEQLQAALFEKRIKRGSYENMVSFISVGPSIISAKMETVDFIEQLLKQQTFLKFNLAAFFPAGAYKMPPEKMGEANKAFAPIIDSLVQFVERFPKFDIVSSIVSNGYADGQGFGAGDLVDTLTANIGRTEATKEELNMELSRLRAEEIERILMDLFKQKIKNVKESDSLVNTRFFKNGKGEDYPNKKIKDYLVDDERRRIVIIYWNALPKGNK